MADAWPTGCGRIVARGKVMCGRCWAEVPAHVQREVYAAWRGRQRAIHVGGSAYEDAVQRHENAKAIAVGSVS